MGALDGGADDDGVDTKECVNRKERVLWIAYIQGRVLINKYERWIMEGVQKTLFLIFEKKK